MTQTNATAATKATKGTKAATSKANSKPATNGKVGGVKKDGLRKPQIRILQCLAKSNKAMTRGEIAAKAPVDVAFCTEYIGSQDDAKRKANDAKHFPSLITLQLVRHTLEDRDGQRVAVHSITAKGKEALRKAEKDAK